ncbi:hypothetical protein [Actinoallomurus sp. NPDC052274]|uniref:hypothetical protein n=1 Tax=Actinoallomurus sp. NPDC052274 TaxID=3155420 RepID=UPI00341CB84B
MNALITIATSVATGGIVGAFVTANIVVAVRSHLMTRAQDRAAYWEDRALRAEDPEFRA